VNRILSTGRAGNLVMEISASIVISVLVASAFFAFLPSDFFRPAAFGIFRWQASRETISISIMVYDLLRNSIICSVAPRSDSRKP
jgi:hypothetical protein